jgi:hypothetical protein
MNKLFTRVVSDTIGSATTPCSVIIYDFFFNFVAQVEAVRYLKNLELKERFICFGMPQYIRICAPNFSSVYVLLLGSKSN